MYQIEDLLDWYYGDRAQFPRDVWVSKVPVEVVPVEYGRTEMRLLPPLPNQEQPRLPLPEGVDRVEYNGMVSERITLKQYVVGDALTVLAAYSDTAKRLFIGEWEPYEDHG